MILNNFCDIFKDTNSWDECKEKMIKFAKNDYSFVGKVLFEKFAKYYFLFNPSLRNDYKIGFDFSSKIQSERIDWQDI